MALLCDCFPHFASMFGILVKCIKLSAFHILSCIALKISGLRVSLLVNHYWISCRVLSARLERVQSWLCLTDAERVSLTGLSPRNIEFLLDCGRLRVVEIWSFYCGQTVRRGSVGYDAVSLVGGYQRFGWTSTHIRNNRYNYTFEYFNLYDWKAKDSELNGSERSPYLIYS
jgi:hypothetical protein